MLFRTDLAYRKTGGKAMAKSSNQLTREFQYVIRNNRNIHTPLLPRPSHRRQTRSQSDAVGALDTTFVTGTIGSEEDANLDL
jgi:hypothetical protein